MNSIRAQCRVNLCENCFTGIALNSTQVDASLEEDVTGSTPVSAPRVADNLEYKQKLVAYTESTQIQVLLMPTYPVFNTIESAIADGGDSVVSINATVRFSVHARPAIIFVIIFIYNLSKQQWLHMYKRRVPSEQY